MNLLLFLHVAFATADYWTDRERFLKEEQSQYVGHNVILSPKEAEVNKMLMQAKNKELEEGFAHPENFPPANHFFLVKDKINKSPVFKFLQKMPKGGALHLHSTAMASVDYIVKNVTYRDHLWACYNKSLNLIFADPPPDGDCWVPLKTLRQKARSVEELDAWLRRKLSLETDDPYEKYPDLNTVWKAFQDIFSFQSSMLKYRPVFEDYYYKALEEFYKDNVNYVEIRASLSYVYDLKGQKMNPLEVLRLAKEVSDRFLSDHPDFLGIKYIYSPHRQVNNKTMEQYLKQFKTMNEVFPDFLVGFDLVGQEDLGKPLIDFVNYLIKQSPDIKFFFHAGETNWNGMTTDMNLVDALLLNTTRVGHGFAMLKHPRVLAAAKRRGVAIELCPVSHQVLGLLRDLRNHPAASMLAQDFPLVVSSDDPGLWGAAPLSHDFYLTFMGIASRTADLKMLKQLVLNSFIYSAIKREDKLRIINKFVFKWDRFIDYVYENGF